MEYIVCFFFFKQKTAYEIGVRLVGSEMCIRDRLCAHAALCGASRDVCAALMNAATTDACMEILDRAEMREPVLSSLLDAIQLHLDRRAAGAFRVGAVLFSNQYGPLGQTRTAKELLDEWKNG